jgi:hypothetical protein
LRKNSGLNQFSGLVVVFAARMTGSIVLFLIGLVACFC